MALKSRDHVRKPTLSQDDVDVLYSRIADEFREICQSGGFATLTNSVSLGRIVRPIQENDCLDERLRL